MAQRCLICSSSTLGVNKPATKLNRVNSSSLLDRQLSSMYVVSRLLEIPEELCIRFLTKYGNPEEWVKICDWCTVLVEEGQGIFDKICQLEREQAKIRAQVRDRMKVKVEQEFMVDQECATMEIQRYIDGLGNLEDASLIIGSSIIEEFDSLKTTKSISSSCLTKSQKLRPSREYNVPAKSRKNHKPVHATNRPTNESTRVVPVRKSSLRDNRMQHKKIHSDTDVLIKKEEETTVEIDNDNCSEDPDFQIEDYGFEPESDDNYGDDNAAGVEDLLNDKKDEDFAPLPTRNSKSRKPAKRKITASQLRKIGEIRPKMIRKKRINTEEILTLEEVIERRNKILESLPPFSRTMSKEDLAIRKDGMHNKRLSDLCKRYRVKEFPCKNCNQVFTVYRDWYTHTGIESCGSKIFNQSGLVIMDRVKCEECGKLVGNVTVLEDHMRTAHFPKEMLACRGCEQIYSKAADYRVHFRKMVESNPTSDCVTLGLRCPKWTETKQCAAVRGGQEALDLHIRVRHLGPPPKSYKCIQCKRSFQSKHYLKLHIQTHGSADFKCDRPNCSSAFPTSVRLQAHIKNVHIPREEGARHLCITCGALFPSKRNLRRHEKIHAPESPYMCTTCGKSYKIANYLTIHMWTHDPEFYKSKYGKYRENAKRRLQQKGKQQNQDDSEVGQSSKKPSGDDKSQQNEATVDFHDFLSI